MTLFFQTVAFGQTPGFTLSGKNSTKQSKVTLKQFGKALSPKAKIKIDGDSIPVGVYQRFLADFADKLRANGLIDKDGKRVDKLDKASQQLAELRALIAYQQARIALGHLPINSINFADAAQKIGQFNKVNISYDDLAAARAAFPRRALNSIPVNQQQRRGNTWSNSWGDREYVGADLTAKNTIETRSNGSVWEASLVGNAYVLDRSRELLNVRHYATALGSRATYNGHFRVAGNTFWSQSYSGTSARRWAYRQRWTRNYTLVNTTIQAIFVPVNLRVSAGGAMGFSFSAAVEARFFDRSVHRRIFNMVFATTSTTIGNNRYEGVFAKLDLSGSAVVDVSLGTLIHAANIFDSDIIAEVADWIGSRTRVGRAGAEVSADLIIVELTFHAENSLNYNSFNRSYSIQGDAHAALNLELIANTTVSVFAGVNVPVGLDIEFKWYIIPVDIDIDWDFKEYRTTLWRQRNPLYSQQIGLFDLDWNVNL